MENFNNKYIQEINMGFLWFNKKGDGSEEKWDQLHKGLKASFSNIKRDFEHSMGHIDHLHSKKEEHHSRLTKIEERLVLLEQMLLDFRGKKSKVERSTIERVQSFNHSESFMNVQTIKNLTPSQKQVVFLLLQSKNPLNYQAIADKVGSNIVTVRRHINDIKRAGVKVKEKISVKNRSKVFYLNDELKKELRQKKVKVKVDSEGNMGENSSEEGIEVVPVRDYIG
ncbi:MAG: helix-turn-helix domain-containing protein [Nanoarchaeota archaeon]|nr:helix-turn-helix domain-containing protein [Nanoarchaeota archaeon]